ncbi:hypothetical protein EDD21DRAFT_414810 [Dissophora ornata]|nr:hypothetical protein EDD21DRAFT_414810 [Dissophora ornata]
MATTIPVTPLPIPSSYSSPSPAPYRQYTITKSLSNAASSTGANAEVAFTTATDGGISSSSSGKTIAVSEEGKEGGRRLEMEQVRGEGPPRFKFPKLLQLNNQHQHQNQRSERNEMQPPPSPLQQRQQLQQREVQHHNHNRQYAAVPPPKYRGPATRLRRGFGFLQSHYHVFHRQSEQQPRVETFVSEDDRDRRVDRSNATTATLLQRRAWSLPMSGGPSNSNSVSRYNTTPTTLSGHRTHRETTAPARSDTLPTKVTDVVLKGGSDDCRQEQGVYSSTIIVPSTTVTEAQMVVEEPTSFLEAVNPIPISSQGGEVGGGAGLKLSLRTLGFFNKVVTSSRSSSTVSSPTSPTFKPQEEVRDQSPGSRVRSPQHISKVLEAGARKIGLIKRKPSSPEHYLSLPVGGATSLHSEDLSTAEFAKLAGITILPEDGSDDGYDDYVTSVSEGGLPFSTDGCTSDSGNGGSKTSSGKVELKLRSGSSSNTFNSARHLTCRSRASNRVIRKTNIWDSQFWIDPSRDKESQISVPSSGLTSSLPVMSLIRTSISSTPSPPTHVSPVTEPSRQDLDKIPPDSLLVSTAVQRLCKLENVSMDSKEPTSAIQGRRHSYSPCGLQSGASSRLVSLRCVDEMSNPPKEAIDLARDLGRRRSYASLTAVAIELESNHALDYKHGPAAFGSNNHEWQQQRQDHHDHSTVSPLQPAHLEPPEATGSSAIAPKSPRSHLHAHSVALHALQPSRSKIRSCHSTGSPDSSVWTRSPSPSPLSRQINLDSPLEESDDFDFLTTARPPMSRNSRYAFIHNGDPSEMGFGPNIQASNLPPPHLPDINRAITEPCSASTSRHHRTHSLPILLPGQMEHPDAHKIQEFQPQVVAPSSLSLPPSLSPSPSSSTPSSPSQSNNLRRPSNSSPSRTFTPGTKVGRFTLVQELSTKHVDVLRARQEQQQQQQQRPVSMVELGSSNREPEIGPLEGPALPATEEQERQEQQQPSEGQNVIPIVITPEENVVIFQRKKKHPVMPPPPTQTAPQAP